MGEQRVSIVSDNKQMQRFVRSLLDDVQALGYMLEHEWFDVDDIHIGAEQEMCLVDNKNYRPATIAMEVLEKMKDYDWVETELAKFNLEINLTPHRFKGKCLSLLAEETQERLSTIRSYLEPMGADYALTGVLPTLKKFQLEMDNLTPKKRYKALMEAINGQLIGSAYELKIIGIDELSVKHNSPLLEACNTSFQVHLQVAPKDFVKMYNIAQTVTAPLMAVAANSPLVFGRRLWHENRIALFQQSLDTRSSHDHMRERSPRVSFGKDWVKDSILDIYREDIARFRVLIAGDIEEDSLALIKEGKIPRLRALQVHNSTVYRWNRPCFGISSNGKPHLRIENRVLASGPTVLDEVANAAFWLGMMEELSHAKVDITERISFPDIKENFAKAAKFGIDCTFNWLDDRTVSAVDLIKNDLLPMARKGLNRRKVDKKDIDKYLGIIEARVDNHINGARWMLKSYTQLKKSTTEDEALATLTANIIKNERSGKPVHEWDSPELRLDSYEPSQLKVSEFMTTDLFTVQKEDIVELVAEMMDWRKIRYTPVEDKDGNLLGLITSRLLLRYYVHKAGENEPQGCVEDIMIVDPVTISHDASLKEALTIMRQRQIGCLPVVRGKELVGIITEMDYLRISTRLLERLNAGMG